MRPFVVVPLAVAALSAACVFGGSPPPHQPRPVPQIDPAPKGMLSIRLLVNVADAQGRDRKFREFHGNTCLPALPSEICPPADAQERLARELVAALQQAGFMVSIDPTSAHDLEINPSLYAMYLGGCRSKDATAITEAERTPAYCAIFGLENGNRGPRRDELDNAVFRMAEGRACGTRERASGMPQWLIGDEVAEGVPPNYPYHAAEFVRILEGCDGVLGYARLLPAETPPAPAQP